jgi:hypothetical protein
MGKEGMPRAALSADGTFELESCCVLMVLSPTTAGLVANNWRR